MFTLQPRHRLDIGLRHFAYALLAGVWARNPEALSARLEAGWSLGSRGLACRSVRSGFHLLLESLALLRGSEVLVSAVTHPDMVRILEAHGLVAVPVDLEVATLSPRLDLAERFVTPRTAAILVAHLFGGRIAMGPLADFAKQHRLVLWEDCAQAFTGPADTGDENADVSMYSFGALKTSTALGGALLTVKDPSLLARMRAAQCRWRLQSRSAYAGNVLKFLVFTLVTRPFPYGLLATVHHALGRDFDRTINSSVKAFRPGPLLPQLERGPSGSCCSRRCWPTGCAPSTGRAYGAAPPPANGSTVASRQPDARRSPDGLAHPLAVSSHLARAGPADPGVPARGRGRRARRIERDRGARSGRPAGSRSRDGSTYDGRPRIPSRISRAFSPLRRPPGGGNRWRGTGASGHKARAPPAAVMTALREESLDRLGKGHFDLLVIGAGIIGARIAFEAARAGLSVALVDAGDFGGATSSASSKLIHDGFRYLPDGGSAPGLGVATRAPRPHGPRRSAPRAAAADGAGRHTGAAREDRL